MSETKIDGTPVRPVPENMPEELVPVYEWFCDHGKDFLVQVAIVIVAIIAAFTFKNYRASRADAASAAFLSANDVAGLEEVNGKFGGSKYGPLIRLRLARAYYDDEKFDMASEAYRAFLDDNKDHALAKEALLGLATSLEADGKYDEALEQYSKIEGDATSPAWVEAQFGKARATALKGDKDAAYKQLDELQPLLQGDDVADVIKGRKELIARFDGFREISGFDKLNALESAMAPADAADVSVAPPADEAVAPPAAE